MWENIKRILKKNIGVCVVVEEGQPSFVVLPFDDYEKTLNSCQNLPLFEQFKKESGESEQEILEKINQEIINWKARQTEENQEIEAVETEEEPKIIENLPIM